jgi:outer membrane immunogenic protein
MKSVLLTTAALVALATVGSAGAADLPVKALPIAPAAVYNWTGFYIGANAGYAWSNNDSVNTVGAVSFINPAFPAGAGAVANALAVVGTNSLPVKTSGFIGGGQIGYNRQFDNNIVLGIEADIQGAAARGSTSATKTTSLAPFGFAGESYVSTATVTKQLDYLGTVRGRIGFLPTPRLLAYATGGLAYGGVSTRTSFNAVESLGNPPYPPVLSASSFSGTRVGWTAGAGLEWLLAANWSAKAEYLYYDLGNSGASSLTLTQINLGAPGGPAPWGAAGVQSSSTRFNGNIVRVGVNYKFGGPVIAKY